MPRSYISTFRILTRSSRQLSSSITPSITYRSRYVPTSLARAPFRLLSSSTSFKMPEQLKASEVRSQTDPSVAKQYDNETPKDQQIQEFFKMVDSNKICMLNTYRNGTGPLGRSMAIAKRSGPDFLFLANAHSNKFSDLNSNPECQISIQDTKTQDWASITGKATVTSNSDPRIKELWSNGVKAWFGDLGDGKHDGSADDPRMSLIEVKAKHVVYWLHQVGALGFAKEVGVAAVTGKVANTGVTRELSGSDIEKARSME